MLMKLTPDSFYFQNGLAFLHKQYFYLIKMGGCFFHHRNLNETQIISVTFNWQLCTEDLVTIFEEIALKSWTIFIRTTEIYFVDGKTVQRIKTDAKKLSPRGENQS